MSTRRVANFKKPSLKFSNEAALNLRNRLGSHVHNTQILNPCMHAMHCVWVLAQAQHLYISQIWKEACLESQTSIPDLWHLYKASHYSLSKYTCILSHGFAWAQDFSQFPPPPPPTTTTHSMAYRKAAPYLFIESIELAIAPTDSPSCIWKCHQYAIDL